MTASTEWRHGFEPRWDYAGQRHCRRRNTCLEPVDGATRRERGNGPEGACSPVASPESNQRRLTGETVAQQMCKSVVSIRVVAAFVRYLPGLSLIRFR